MVMDILANIIQRYDVMLMMEIRDDADQTAMLKLWEMVNRTSPFGLTLSKPLGRNHHRYREQYGFFYRIGKAYLADTFLYDDSVNDEFEREPYAALIKTSPESSHSGTSFIGVHVQPKMAAAEMGNMVQVTDVILRHWATDRAVIMGDMNADCAYMTARDLAQTPLNTDPRFTWLISDTADTTVSGNTDCAYDRMIVTNTLSHRNPSVFNYQAEYSLTFSEARDVSDHYPIEAELCMI